MSVALTRSRFTNALRCYVSYALSRFGLVHISHMPTFVSVERFSAFPFAYLPFAYLPFAIRLSPFAIIRQRRAGEYLPIKVSRLPRRTS